MKNNSNFRSPENINVRYIDILFTYNTDFVNATNVNDKPLYNLSSEIRYF